MERPTVTAGHLGLALGSLPPATAPTTVIEVRGDGSVSPYAGQKADALIVDDPLTHEVDAAERAARLAMHERPMAKPAPAPPVTDGRKRPPPVMRIDAVQFKTTDLGDGRTRTKVVTHPLARPPAMSLRQLANRKPRRR